MTRPIRARVYGSHLTMTFPSVDDAAAEMSMSPEHLEELADTAGAHDGLIWSWGKYAASEKQRANGRRVAAMMRERMRQRRQAQE